MTAPHWSEAPRLTAGWTSLPCPGPMAHEVSRRGGRPGPPKQRRKPGAPMVRRGTLRLPHEVARRIRLGHPWVYREALDPRRVVKDQPGAPVELVDWDGDFVGR